MVFAGPVQPDDNSRPCMYRDDHPQDHSGMRTMRITRWGAISVLALLAGCDAVMDKILDRSTNYYLSHHDERDAKIAKCISAPIYVESELSESCRNAVHARDALIEYAEKQKAPPAKAVELFPTNECVFSYDRTRRVMNEQCTGQSLFLNLDAQMALREGRATRCWVKYSSGGGQQQGCQ